MADKEVKKVTKINENVYLINDIVQISNVEMNEEGIICDLNFNKEDITEAEAHLLIEKFITEALQDAIKNYEE